MIYVKLPHTTPPMRAVTGTRYNIIATAKDGQRFSISYTLSNIEYEALRFPRKVIADRLRMMRATLRGRVAEYENSTADL